MFRLKLTLLYFFTLVLVVVVVCLFVGQQQEDFVQEQLRPSLDSAASSYSYLTKSRLDDLKGFVAEMAESDLALYMGVLHDNGEQVRDLMMQTRQTFPNRKRENPKRILDFVDEKGKALMDEMAARVGREGTKSLDLDGGFGKFVRDDILSVCLAEEDPRSVCLFQMSWLVLTQILFPGALERHQESFPDLFILADSEGKTRLVFDGLRASVGSMVVRRSGQKSLEEALGDALFTAGTRYKDHIRTFDQLGLLLRRLDDPASPQVVTSFMALHGDKLFVVAASRVRTAIGQELGTVVAGYELGRGTAWEDTAIALGIRPVLQRCLSIFRGAEQAEDGPSERLCEYEMERQENGITYVYRNSKGQTVRGGTSLPDSMASGVVQASKDLGTETTVIMDGVLARAIDLPLDFVPRGESLRAVLSVDTEAAVAPFGAIRLVVVILGVIVFIVGLLLVQLAVRSFTRPFEELDRGIHEIIGGNFAYSFPFNFNESLPRSMGQSLTIMKAVLLGEPLPEDVETDDGWAASLRVGGDGGGGELESVETGSGEIEELKASELKESANEYYRRLFREYVQAKEHLGEDVSKITYIKFVDKIARTEKSLRDRLGCKQVHFKVETKDRQVVLVPIKIVE